MKKAAFKTLSFLFALILLFAIPLSVCAETAPSAVSSDPAVSAGESQPNVQEDELKVVTAAAISLGVVLLVAFLLLFIIGAVTVSSIKKKK